MSSIYTKQAYFEQKRFKASYGGPPGRIMRIPVHNDEPRRGDSQAAVVPIRQFCEVKKPDPETRSASFVRSGNVSVVTPPDDNLAECVTYKPLRGRAEERRLLDATFDCVPPQQRDDLRDKMRDVYMRKALDDEASVLLDSVYGDDGPGGQGCGDKRNFWINGNTGIDVDDDSLINGGSKDYLTCRGLLAAWNKICDHCSGDARTICYTTALALTCLKNDPDFERNGGSFLGGAAAAAAGDMAVIRGICVVAAPLPEAPACGARSFMFVPNVSFGLVSDDRVAVMDTPYGEKGLRFMASHIVGGVVMAERSTCRISHA